MKDSKLLIVCLLICEIALCLHLKQSETNVHDNKQNSIESVMKYYRIDDQIEKQINQVIKSQPDSFIKYQCKNDNNYKYVVIDRRNQNDGNNKMKGIDNKDKIKKQVVIVCNVHARQILVSQVCLDFITNLSATLANKDGVQMKQKKNQKISKNQTADKISVKNEFDFNQVNHLLQNAKITVFYRGNSMRDQVILKKQYCIRKDQNNIDINRNFPTNFNLNNAAQDQQQYPGDYPISQPFSICLENYLQSINQTSKVNIFIDIHTGQFTLFNSFQKEQEKGLEARPILQKLKQYCPQCRITTIGSEDDDQITDGQIFPDVKKRYDADFSVLLQIYGGFNSNLSPKQNCIAIFNPTNQKQLIYYKNVWKNGLLYFVKEAVNKVNQIQKQK